MTRPGVALHPPDPFFREVDPPTPRPFEERIIAALGQAAERMAQLENRINQIELRLEGMKSPAWSEVERLQKELVQIRVFADHAETRIASIADKAGFVPSEFVDKPTWNGWRHGFDERLRALERKVGTS